MFHKAWYRIRDYLFPLKRFMRKKTKEPDRTFYRSQPKPKWVKHEIIKLKAFLPQAGCRTIADTFNRIFLFEEMSVGKSFVHGVLQRHDYQIQVLRKKIKNARPRPIPNNLIWGMDLTGKMDMQGNLLMLLGIVEHQSRANLFLQALPIKSSMQLLISLLQTIKRFGRPKIVRTDNEAVFTSYLFKTVLRFMRAEEKRKRGQIYFLLHSSFSFEGLPCFLNSTRLPIFFATSSTNRLPPVSCPL